MYITLSKSKNKIIYIYITWLFLYCALIYFHTVLNYKFLRYSQGNRNILLPFKPCSLLNLKHMFISWPKFLSHDANKYGGISRYKSKINLYFNRSLAYKSFIPGAAVKTYCFTNNCNIGLLASNPYAQQFFICFHLHSKQFRIFSF
jgi:hypothetical protein